ncbi:MAG: phage BR0599 family protein, partial [Waterburya sp.]
TPSVNTIELDNTITGTHANRLIGGSLRINTGQFTGLELRIVDKSANSIAYEGNIPDTLTPGTEITIRVQCNKILGDCTAFNNADNFGGILTGGLWMPSLNNIIYVNE